MNYKGVIFDLDGTLVNSLTDLANSVNTVLTEYNLPTHDIESYKYRVGNGIKKLMERSLPQDKQYLLDEALAKFKQVYAKHNLDHTAPYKNIVKLLFGEGIFSEIIGDKAGLKRKPDPGKVLMITQNWQLKPQEIAYLGDSDVDMQTAKNADMLAVGVLWGFRPADELKQNGADILIAKPLDLLTQVSFAK